MTFCGFVNFNPFKLFWFAKNNQVVYDTAKISQGGCDD
jgi:hypothetical protein